MPGLLFRLLYGAAQLLNTKGKKRLFGDKLCPCRGPCRPDDEEPDKHPEKLSPAVCPLVDGKYVPPRGPIFPPIDDGLFLCLTVVIQTDRFDAEQINKNRQIP
jgi:hypothetical protein